MGCAGGDIEPQPLGLVQSSFGGQSSIAYAYDAGSRMTQAVDSITGAISRAYDSLDRLTAEATPQGSVGYSYDAAGRRTSMGIPGQSVVNYSYDNDNRLTQITQGASNVGFTYDSDSRRTSLTLPNGVTMSYGYDAAGQLLGINYQLGNSLLGNLTYTYDLDEDRTMAGGSFAQTGLPAALASASFNADNQLTQLGSSNLTYDANGNLTSDGTHTYTWDARNRLVSISGAVSASFAYDPFGRRVSKTIGAATTNYLYDGANPVQELSGGSPTANLLTGLRIDEYFQRTDANGAANFLTDALGSTIALTGPGGNTLAQYTYDPYGNTAMTGNSANPYQFTGRENDGTGLYYYRTRYYSPKMGRFISEDPIRFQGGINFYSYVKNNPIDFTDPSGLVDFSEAQTFELLQRIYAESTDGPIQGLENIYHNSNRGGEYDFGHMEEHNYDTWTWCGKKMNPDQFGNFVAGFEGASYDRMYFLTTGGENAELAVHLYGILFHVNKETKAKNDPLDFTGRPDIIAGQNAGWTFNPNRDRCACQK